MCHIKILWFRFCGWVDVELSHVGQSEAQQAARSIVESDVRVTKIYTSLLKRAHQTVEYVVR